MEITATIINTIVDYNSAGEAINYDFEWRGPEDGILGISGELMRDADRAIFIRPESPQVGDEVVFGPYKLTIVEHQKQPVEIYYCTRNLSP